MRYQGLLLLSTFAICGSSAAQTTPDLQQQINSLKQQLASLETQLHQQQAATLAAQKETTKTQEKKQNEVKIGGAVRVNMGVNSYEKGNKDRHGDFDFDMMALKFNGNVDDILLSTELRFYDYMTTIKYAWLGYEFAPDWQIKAGITPVRFGNQPYNSHSYFFSPNYYIGLEDDFDLGLLVSRQMKDNWRLDFGFYKNDELGGVDGYVDDRTKRYSYDVVGVRATGTEGIYDAPAQKVGEYNTLSGRLGYQLDLGDIKSEIGTSALYGGLHDNQHRVGNYHAWAVHLNSNYQRWNLQLQHSQYDYDLKNNATQMAVGAYGFYDTIAAQAKSFNANLAYTLPVSFGPISQLQFYNDYGMIYDKSDNSRDTFMNTTGVAVSAGNFFSYVDFVNAKNQPFIGGSIAGDDAKTEQRFNINLGYYF